MKFLLAEVVKPLLHRVGSAVGVFVASADYFSAAEIDTLQTASILVAGFVLDRLLERGAK